jgi:SAM-dependent methyltransferase
MKISEGIKTLKGKPVEIPDCGRNDIPGFIKETGGKKIVEIGVFRGEYTKVLADSGLDVYGVDPWLAYPDYPYYNKDDEQWREDGNFQMTVELLQGYGNVHLVRETSMNALYLFEDNSLDAVYIDGNHSFKYVAEDICEWIKKVKPGGWICGHDYFYGNPKKMHVRHVVDAYVEAHGIPNLWILGRKHAEPEEVRDEWRSWMFQKPYEN